MNAKKMYSPILTPDSQHLMIRVRNGSSNLILSSQIKKTTYASHVNIKYTVVDKNACLSIQIVDS
jgi:hypothetical protein